MKCATALSSLLLLVMMLGTTAGCGGGYDDGKKECRQQYCESSCVEHYDYGYRYQLRQLGRVASATDGDELSSHQPKVAELDLSFGIDPATTSSHSCYNSCYDDAFDDGCRLGRDIGRERGEGCEHLGATDALLGLRPDPNRAIGTVCRF